MEEDRSHLTIEELAEQLDISVRTIRYYIAEGLLPGPEGRGKATTYGEEHLLRLRLIRLLSNQRMPLAEMYHLLNQLSLAEIRALLAEEEQRARKLERGSPGPPPQEYIATLLRNAQAVRRASQEASAAWPALVQPAAPSSAKKVYEMPEVYETPRAPDGETWKRWELVPGIELHIKNGVEDQHHSLIERIFKIAGIPFQRSRK